MHTLFRLVVILQHFKLITVRFFNKYFPVWSCNNTFDLFVSNISEILSQLHNMSRIGQFIIALVENLTLNEQMSQ